MSELNQIMEELKKLTELLTEETTPTAKATMPSNLDCGDVCYTRLFKADEELMDDLCKKTGRKKAQIIRILVSDGLRRGVIDATN